MIADWYFLNCLHFPPKRAACILCIFEAIDAAHPDVILAVLAVQELQKAEVAVQIYAVPKLTKLLRRVSVDSARLREVVLNFLLRLTEEAEDSVQQRLEDFVRLSITQMDGSSGVKEAIELARRIAPSSSATANAPYLDLNERLVETFLLAGLEALALTPGGEALTAIEGILNEGAGSLAGLVDSALEGSLGRLAFLQALGLQFEIRALSSQDQPVWADTSPLVKLKGALPLDEPDLVQVAVRIVLSGNSDCSMEMLHLKAFRRLRRSLRARPRKGQVSIRKQVAAHLGLDEELKPVLQIVLWQVALASFMTERCPAKLVEGTASWWCQAPTTPPDWPMPVNPGEWEQHTESWFGCLSELVTLRVPNVPERRAFYLVRKNTNTLQSAGNNGQTIFEREVLPLLLSPWSEPRQEPLQRSGWRPEPTQREDFHGGNLLHNLNTLRLCCATCQALRVLADFQVGEAGRDNLLKVMAFFDHAIKPYRQWLIDAWTHDVPPPRSDSKRIPLELTSMVLFVRQQLLAAIKGFRRGASPAAFSSLSKERTDWYEDVLVRWVQDVSGFEGVAPNASEWLREFKNFGPLVAAGRNAAQQTAVILLRLFAPQLVAPGVRPPTWQQKCRNKLLNKEDKLLVSNRQILADPLEHWEDWDGYSHLMAEPAPQLGALPPDVANAVTTLQLTTAVERLLGRFGESEKSESARNRWIDDLATMLTRVTEPGHVDRLVMVRLVALVSTPALRGRAETRLAVVRLLVEQAGSTALLLLVRQLLETPVDERAVLIWPKLQIAALRGLWAKAKLRAGENASPQDPTHLLQAVKEVQCLERLTQLLLVGPTQGLDEAETAQLREEFLRLEREQVRTVGRRWFRGIHDPDQGRLLVESEPDVALEDWMVKQAVQDPDTGDFALMFDIRGIPQCPRNPGEPRLAFLAGRDTRGLGAVLDLHGNWHQGIDTIALLDEIPGQPVLLAPIEKKMEFLAARLQIGDMADVEVSRRIERNSLGECLRIEPCVKGTLPSVSLDLRLWDADLSRGFWEKNPPTRKVPAVYNGDGAWVPLTHGLAAFLCRGPRGGATPRATLTFLSQTVGNDGSERWLFAGDPGELFEFSADEFTDAAAQAIRAEVKAIGEQFPCAGLLVSVGAIRDEDRVRLVLMKEPWSPCLHPQLVCPFDRRNLDWRQLFKPGDQVRAEYDQTLKHWFVRAEIGGGFPDHIRVHWTSGRQPDPQLEWITGILGVWNDSDQRSGWVFAKVASNSLDLSDLRGLFDSLSHLKKSDVRQLSEPLYREIGEQAEISCFTTEKLLVSVRLDSITLLPISEVADAWVRGRKLAIEHMEWQREEMVRLTFADDAPPQLSEGWNIGVLVVTPKNDVSGLCKVLLNQGRDLCSIRIEGRSKLGPLKLGSRLRVEIKQGLVRNATVQKFWIHAGALWKMETMATPQHEAIFVGRCSWNNAIVFASESLTRPGVLQLTPSDGVEPTLFARWDARAGTWKPGLLEAIWPANDLAESRHYRNVDGKHLTPVRLAPRTPSWKRDPRLKDTSLAGLCNSALDAQACRVLRTQLRVEKAAGNEASVWRIFDVDAQLANRPEVELTQIGLPEHLVLLAQSEPVQSCWVDSKRNDCQLAALQRAGFDKRQSTLPIAKHGGPWVTVRKTAYSQKGNGYLERVDGQWTIDFRRVKPLSAEEYRALLGATPTEPPSEEPILANLYFVGPINDPGQEEQPYVWRFEAGYGLSVIIPENHLLVQGRSFNLRHLLFHGDRIKEFKFVKIIDEQNGSSHWGIDIKDVAIDPAPATVLYRQAKKFKVVHLLGVRAEPGAVLEIVSIRGCEENRISGAEEQFIVPQARLDSESVVRLQSRFGRPQTQEGSGSDGGEKVIYGRMNVKAFELSFGFDVEFEHLSLTNADQPGLRGGELLLLEAVRLEPRRNDVFLYLDDLAHQPGDALTVIVPRRRFSQRESLLRRINEEKGEFESEVRFHIFAVRLDASFAKTGTPRGSLLQDIPDRRTQALLNHVQATGEPVFAVVVGLREPRKQEMPGVSAIRLEHRPGIFFSLTASDCSGGILPNLAKGTLVHIRLIEERFQLLVCSYGDSAYFKAGPRVVVALPLPALLNNKEAASEAGAQGSPWWDEREGGFRGFTLGDFPGTLCMAKKMDRDGRLHAPDSAAMLDLMGRRHPKLAMVLYDRDRGPVLIPEVGSFVVGAIDLSNKEAPEPFLDSRMQPRTQLVWMALTFSDAPVSQIVRRFRDRKWRYHDDTTGGWNDGIVVDDEETGDHTMSRGPLLFTQSESGFRLRYPGELLIARAIPVGDLLEAFGRNCLRVSIAGVAMIGRQGGLYVEFLPGRILHLPGALFFWRSKTGRVPLARLDWRHFGEGDEISIRVDEGAVLAPDYLDLEEWHPGPRSCFGHDRVLLPVVRFDAESGGLQLGGGAFQLTVPCTKQPSRSTVWLNSDNRLADFNSQVQAPKRGDCCLLGVDPVSGDVIVLGLPGFRAMPDRASDSAPAALWHGWESVVFHSASPGQMPAVNWDRLHEGIRALGGVIPATVEGVNCDSKYLYFSLRHQTCDVARDHIAVATVLGYLPDSLDKGERATDQILLRVGGGIALVNFDEVVSGVPTPFRSSVAARLAEERIWVWLATNAVGTLSVGLQPDVTSELSITPLIVVEKNANYDDQWGMVVRSDVSQKLYWVPDTDASWIKISTSEAREHFIQRHRNRSFCARKIVAGEGTFLSIVEGRAVIKESEGLRTGCELSVLVRQPVGLQNAEAGLRKWLAESATAGLLVLLETPVEDEPAMLNAISTKIAIRTEIVYVRRGRREARQWRVATVPTGKRVYRLALPSHFTQLAPKGTDSSWDNTLCLWLAEADQQPWDERRLAQSPEEPSERRLFHAAVLSETRPGSDVVWNAAREVLDLLRKGEEVPLIVALLALKILVDQLLALRKDKMHLQNRLLHTVDLVGRRAVCSLHTEALEHALQSHDFSSSVEAKRIWNRVRHILERPLDASQMLRLRNLLQFAMIADDDLTRSLSFSIYIATGRIPEQGLGSDYCAEVLTRLIGWHRIFSQFHQDADLPPQAILQFKEELRIVLQQVRNSAIGIVLLAPLPPITFSARD